VVLITHKLRDALAVADDFTVLRHGRVAWSGPAAEASERQLASAMLGETVPAGDGAPGREEVLRVLEGERVLPPSPVPAAASPVVARADALWVRDGRGVMRVRDVTIACHAGEIVGIAGIEGAGQHELLRALAGRIVPTRGTLTLPARVGFIPEDRHRDGLMLDEEIVSNIALRDAHARRGTMPWQALRTETGTIIEQYDVRGAGTATVARALSGGNQQKLVLGRELHGRPPLLVAENPTRGLDFHATLAIQRALRTARDEGTAIVFYSSDLDEVIALSDRVFAMREGELAQCSRDRNAVGRAMLSAS
jgi:general nucleoside transport system ATP-binding protein